MKYLIPVAALILAAQAAAQPAERAKAAALVQEAIALAKSGGKDALVKQINFGSGRFHVGPGRPLYLFIYDGTGKCQAHGADSVFIGTNRLGVKDPDGTPYIAQIAKLAQTGGKGWVDYKFINPADGKLAPKTSYVETFEGWAVCCGVYK
jgi:signal transduction histidine kinase